MAPKDNEKQKKPELPLIPQETQVSKEQELLRGNINTIQGLRI